MPRRRPVASTGARRRRVLVWSGVAIPPVFVVARFWVSSFERERERRRHFPSVGRSLAPLVCKKRRVFIRLNRHVGYYYYVSPRLRQRPGGGHSSPLQVVSVQAALSVVFQGSSAAPRSPRPQPRPSCSTVVGGRESWLWYRKWPSEIRCCSGCSERSSSKLCYHVGACHPASQN